MLSRYQYLLLGVLLLAGVMNAELVRTDQILTKHIKATGGRNVIANLTSVVSEASVEAGGLTGNYTSWVVPPLRTRTRLRLGITDETVSYNGEEQWTVDSYGTLKIGDPQERRTAYSRALIAGYGYMFPDTTVRIRYLDRRGEFGRSFIVLEVLPEQGVPIKLWIDEETFLLARSEIAADGFTEITEYSDYRSVNGLMVPYVMKNITVELQQERQFFVTKVEVNGYVDERLFVIAEPVEENCIIHEGNKTPEIPFEFVSGRIYLEGTINGEGPFDFILDTGSKVTLVNKSVAKRLGLPHAGEFTSSESNAFAGAPMVQIDSISLPGIGFYGQVVVSVDPADYSDLAYTRQPDLVIGYECLSQLATEIRFSDSNLVFHLGQGFAAPAGYAFIDCSYEELVPVVETHLEQIRGRFVVSTSSWAAIDCTEPYFRRNGLKKGRKTVPSELHPLKNDADMHAARMKFISFGPHVMQNVSVGFAEEASNGFFTSGVLDGIIGTEILRRFDLIFDYPAGRLALKPNDALEDEFRFGKSGLKLRVEESGITVIEVIPGSPAEEAMIEPGSALVTVDGLNAHTIGMDGLREIFTRPDGTEIEVLTSKNGQPRTSILKLRTYY